ncbi:glucuronate isomerase [Stutzerimonas nitrititolerans]|uniref:glucuronate isomerase n=1 Tax=Stutzerimonas nitrititolerans TaxID=2482751 RepID=UPI00289F8AFC|nr:glucuronate isomerase [Stutzerimonas nitrititolerans]
MTYITDDFLLDTPCARHLYHEYAAGLPIIDLHSHLCPAAVALDRPFNSLDELWLAGDHYKWRAMRGDGMSDAAVMDDAAGFDRFTRWVETLQRLVGSPLYHWTHMELFRFFGIGECLHQDNAAAVWNSCNERINASGGMRPGSILQTVNAEVITTTNSPSDNLAHHRYHATNNGNAVRMLPCWRPDLLLELGNSEFPNTASSLSQCVGFEIRDLEGLQRALCDRLNFFEFHGCVSSDHALDAFAFVDYDHKKVDRIFRNTLSGIAPSVVEQHAYVTFLLRFLALEYSNRSWTQHLHVGARRDQNSMMFGVHGPNSGFDGIGSTGVVSQLNMLLDRMNSESALPRSVIYCSNPAEYPEAMTLAGCFPSTASRPHVQVGPAWWFNDTIDGIREHLKLSAGYGVLGNLLGMVTDSRSFLSMVRHEYFRRILCRLLGGWARDGLIPFDETLLSNLVLDLSYRNSLSLVSGNQQQTRIAGKNG